MRAPEPFDYPSCIFELKMDGFRALAYIDGGQCQLASRKGNIYKSFASLSSTLAGLGRQAILEGDLCLDAAGKPQFYDLLRRRREPIFYAFDVLWLDGEDLRSRPTPERKLLLEDPSSRLRRHPVRAAFPAPRNRSVPLGVRAGPGGHRREAHNGAIRLRADAVDQGAEPELFAAGRPAGVIRAEAHGGDKSLTMPRFQDSDEPSSLTPW